MKSAIVRFTTVCVSAVSLSAVLLVTDCKEKPEANPELTRVSKPIPGKLPYFRGTIMDPFWSASGELPDDLRRFGEVTFTSHKGEPNPKKSRDGSITLVTFFYTSCMGICPMITNNMKDLSAQIVDQKDLMFLSITVNPEIDDAKTIRKYRAEHQINQENWLFLTGAKADIETLARQQFAAEIEARSGRSDLLDFVHTENVFLLDQEGYLRGVYRARGTGDFSRLIQDLKTLRAEKKS